MIIKVSKIPFKANAAALTIGPFIFVTDEYADNKSYIEHEKFHVRMFLYFVAVSAVIAAALWFFGFVGLWTAIPLAFTGAAARAGLYTLSEKFRLWEEIRGYAIQAAIEKHSKEKMEKTAALIRANYNVKKATEAKIFGKLVDDRQIYDERFGA